MVGGDGHEGRLREGEGLEDTPTDTEQVVSLDEVKPWVVTMHRVEDDLWGGRESESTINKKKGGGEKVGGGERGERERKRRKKPGYNYTSNHRINESLILTFKDFQ